MIIEKRGNKKFSYVKRGEVFEVNGDVFIRARDYFDINAVELITGNLFNIDPEAEVRIYDEAKVVIK